jgi:hypothetical protein
MHLWLMAMPALQFRALDSVEFLHKDVLRFGGANALSKNGTR